MPMMENNSPVKQSVAELAERFKGHTVPMPISNEQSQHVPRRPPCSLQLHKKEDDELNKTTISFPNKRKMKNSPFIEKLQANLALSPTSLLPSPKSPEVKLQPSPLSPADPCSVISPNYSHTLLPSQQSTDDEEPVSFERPAEGATLPSFNKSRARLSFKRRPPTRRHRRPAREEAGGSGADLSPCGLDSPAKNGDEVQVFHISALQTGDGQDSSPPHSAILIEKDVDYATADDKVPGNAPSDAANPDRQISKEHEITEVQDREATEDLQHAASLPAKAVDGDFSVRSTTVSH